MARHLAITIHTEPIDKEDWQSYCNLIRNLLERNRLQATLYDDIDNRCAYCSNPPDGPMLYMGGNIAHVDCVIRKLNELLDYDYDGTGEPLEIVSRKWWYEKIFRQEGQTEKTEQTETEGQSPAS